MTWSRVLGVATEELLMIGPRRLARSHGVRNVQPTEPRARTGSAHGAHDRGDVVFGVPQVERRPRASGATRDADACRAHALELRAVGVGPRHDRLVLLRKPELVAQQLTEPCGDRKSTRLNSSH